MSLTAADVAEIMRLVEQSGFDELNLEINGTKISLRRGSPAPGVPAALAVAVAAAPAAVASTPKPASDPDVQDLPAPLLGTFYRAPKPGAPAFVEVGSQVSDDTIIGIIEVMKLMNTVRAGARGTITEIIAADGALVEFGAPLMRVRKSG
jgi:acetyl-CoA carboxylase biotin carboxyl carrier protein